MLVTTSFEMKFNNNSTHLHRVLIEVRSLLYSYFRYTAMVPIFRPSWGLDASP